MTIYEYVCHETGERKTITASMRNPPATKFEEDGRTWCRDWGDVKTAIGVRGLGPNFKGRAIPNIAPNLPANGSPYREIERGGVTLREHQDGTFSDHQGHRIIEGGETGMAKACEAQGREYVPNAS